MPAHSWVGISCGNRYAIKTLRRRPTARRKTPICRNISFTSITLSGYSLAKSRRRVGAIWSMRYFEPAGVRCNPSLTSSSFPIRLRQPDSLQKTLRVDVSSVFLARLHRFSRIGAGLLRVVAAEKGRHLRRPKFRELPCRTAITTYGDSLAGGVSPFTQRPHEVTVRPGVRSRAGYGASWMRSLALAIDAA
jgi:hypothetical protein